MTVLGDLLRLHPPNRKTFWCTACLGERPEGQLRRAVVQVKGQDLNLCANHAVEAAHELAATAEALLQAASEADLATSRTYQRLQAFAEGFKR